MNNIPVKDILYIAGILFTMGFSLASHFNHIRHNSAAIKEIKESINELFSKTNANGKAIAKIEGRLNNRK